MKIWFSVYNNNTFMFEITNNDINKNSDFDLKIIIVRNTIKLYSYLL